MCKRLGRWGETASTGPGELREEVISEQFVFLVISLLELKILFIALSPTNALLGNFDWCMRHHHGNRRVGMISDFGRRVSPSGLLRPPKGCVCVSVRLLCIYELFLAKTLPPAVASHSKGLIGLKSVMIEQLTRTHMTPQVWSLTSTHGGAVHWWLELILCDALWQASDGKVLWEIKTQQSERIKWRKICEVMLASSSGLKCN